MKKTNFLATIIFLIVVSIQYVSAQSVTTAKQAGQLYIESIINGNKESLQKLNEYLKPLYSKEDLAKNPNIITVESLEDIANNSAIYVINNMPENYEKAKPSLYAYFYELHKMICQSECKITNVSISDNEYVPGEKIATIDYTSIIKEINFDNLPLIDEKSSVKDFVAYYDEMTKRLKEAKEPKIVTGSFDLYGTKPAEEIKAKDELIWNTGDPNSIMNPIIDAVYPQVE